MPRGYLKVFQYGSNMNAERINSPERLDGKTRVAGVARLDGYGIRFDLYSIRNGCGVTDIAKAANEHVLGVLYEVPIRLVVAPAGRQSKMDEFEGACSNGTGNYLRIRLSVVMGKRNVSAITYIGTDAGRQWNGK
jgi:Gamma-glutamyl cyclotransferase, AIG2-like